MKARGVKRQAVIYLRMTREEKKKVQALANEAGMSVVTFVRAKVLGVLA